MLKQGKISMGTFYTHRFRINQNR
uniref:Uncharacterized protein n=1 Tax=Anguilla anguilla TaxID=7936 RepID=A0A0E9UB02_ANGAN